MRVTIDPRQIAGLKAAIENTGRSLRKELLIAVRSTAKKSEALIAKRLSKDLNLKQKVVKRAVRISATPSIMDLSATVEVRKDKRFNLTSFGAKENKQGVAYQTLKGGARKTAKGAFQIDRWGGRTFKRVGKQRGPLRNLRGPSPWGRFVVGGLMGPSAEETEAELKKQIDRRIRFIRLKSSGDI